MQGLIPTTWALPCVPIAGKLISEIMLDGRARTIEDLSALSPNRFGLAPAVREDNVI